MDQDAPVYDTIGRSYSSTRREDPRIAAQIHAALGAGRTLVNVGAGTGNYEPTDRLVVAVEPSPTMLAQRVDRSPLVVRGGAEALPFADDTFDAALAVLTIHHWSDPTAGLRELRRVADRQVVLFFDTTMSRTFWAMDYFPGGRTSQVELAAPGADELGDALRLREVQAVTVPIDCQDGFGMAYWARPEAYLEPAVQAGMSWLALLSDDERAAGSDALRRDLASGEWHRRYGHLLEQREYDAGYRLAVADG